MSNDERQARIAAIKARLEAATPGPWEFDSYCRVLAPMEHLDDDEHYGNIVAWVPAWHGDTACKPHDDNADLIANAPADIAYLLSELEAERAALADSRERAQGEHPFMPCQPGSCALPHPLPAPDESGCHWPYGNVFFGGIKPYRNGDVICMLTEAQHRRHAGQEREGA